MRGNRSVKLPIVLNSKIADDYFNEMCKNYIQSERQMLKLKLQ